MGTYDDGKVFWPNGKNAGSYSHGIVYDASQTKIGSYRKDRLIYPGGKEAALFTGGEDGAAAALILLWEHEFSAGT